MSVLGASVSGYHGRRQRVPSARTIRHARLTGLITETHETSRRTYAARRLHAELVLGRGIQAGGSQVELLVRRAGLSGLPARRRYRTMSGEPLAADLVDRNFAVRPARSPADRRHHRAPNARGQSLLLCGVRRLQPARRRLIDRHDPDRGARDQGARDGDRGSVTRAGDDSALDHGTQFASWAFTQRAKEPRLLASLGSIGDCFDNPVAEVFCARMQAELLNRRRWRTGIDRSCQLDRRVPRDLPQPPAPSLGPRDAHPARVRDALSIRPTGSVSQISGLRETQGRPEPPTDPGQFTSVTSFGWRIRSSMSHRPRTLRSSMSMSTLEKRRTALAVSNLPSASEVIS